MGIVVGVVAALALGVVVYFYVKGKNATTKEQAASSKYSKFQDADELEDEDNL